MTPEDYMDAVVIGRERMAGRARRVRTDARAEAIEGMFNEVFKATARAAESHADIRSILYGATDALARFASAQRSEGVTDEELAEVIRDRILDCLERQG